MNHQEKQTQKFFTELVTIKQLQRQEATRSREADEVTHGAVKDIAQKQDDLLETINDHGRAVEGLLEMLVNSLEAKLESTLNSLKSQYPTPTETHQEANNGYARAAAQLASGQPQTDTEHVGKYTTMARQTTNTNCTATQTNGNLVRLYVRD